MAAQDEDDVAVEPHSRLVDQVVGPAVKVAGEQFLAHLDGYTVEDLCQKAEESRVFSHHGAATVDFAI